jgi:hypothetical protein
MEAVRKANKDARETGQKLANVIVKDCSKGLLAQK